MKAQVVDQKEKQAPFQKGYIQAFEPACAEIPWVVRVLLRKEISGCDEKERHVEGVNYAGQEPWSFGMPDHHQDDGYSLAY